MAVERIRTLDVEAAVVVAYGLILPPSILHLPPRGCINVHASLLPRFRGAAPIAHAIFRGETRTGVTTLLMDEGIDTGPLLLQRDCPLGEEETAGEVEARLAEMGAALLLETLEGLIGGRIRPRAQEIDRETYAPKIRPEAAWISWARDAASLVNLVRGLNPRPGASTSAGSRVLKVWRAARGPGRIGDDSAAVPGTVLSGGGAPRVACGGSDSLLLLEIQMEGRRRVAGEEAVRGRWFHPGDHFGEASESGGRETGPATPGL